MKHDTKTCFCALCEGRREWKRERKAENEKQMNFCAGMDAFIRLQPYTYPNGAIFYEEWKKEK